jgi:hypothetical protein
MTLKYNAFYWLLSQNNIDKTYYHFRDDYNSLNLGWSLWTNGSNISSFLSMPIIYSDMSLSIILQCPVMINITDSPLASQPPIYISNDTNSPLPNTTSPQGNEIRLEGNKVLIIVICLGFIWCIGFILIVALCKKCRTRYDFLNNNGNGGDGDIKLEKLNDDKDNDLIVYDSITSDDETLTKRKNIILQELVNIGKNNDNNNPEMNPFTGSIINRTKNTNKVHET